MATEILPQSNIDNTLASKPVVRQLRESIHAQEIAAVLARADMHIGVTNRRTPYFYQQLGELAVRMLSEPAVRVADHRAIEKMCVHLAQRLDEEDFTPPPYGAAVTFKDTSTYRIAAELWRLGKACFKDSLTGERQ